MYCVYSGLRRNPSLAASSYADVSDFPAKVVSTTHRRGRSIEVGRDALAILALLIQHLKPASLDKHVNPGAERTCDDTYNLHADVPPPPLLRAFPLRPTAKYLGRMELLPYELGVCRPCHLD